MNNDVKQFCLYRGRMVEAGGGEKAYYPRFVDAEAYSALFEELNALKAAFEKPIAWQARFIGQEWDSCSREHHDLILRTPKEWPDYEVREVFAKPQEIKAVDNQDMNHE